MTDMQASRTRSAMKSHPADVLGEIEADLTMLGERYPVFRSTRFRALALTIEAHLSDACREDRALASLVSLWIAAFDDLVDEEQITGTDLHGLTDRYKASARDSLARAADPGQQRRKLNSAQLEPAEQLDRALEEITRGVVRRRPGEPLKAYWLATFERMVDGIVAQRELGTQWYVETMDGSEVTDFILPVDAAVTYQTLMETLLHSIGVPFYLATCFITYREATLAERLPELTPIVEACAKAVRLANDLQSWQKDSRERNANVVVATAAEIARSHPGLPHAEYQERALALLDERLKLEVSGVLSLLAASSVPGGKAERGIARLVEFVTTFYATYDYHTYRPVPRPSEPPANTP